MAALLSYKGRPLIVSDDDLVASREETAVAAKVSFTAIRNTCAVSISIDNRHVFVRQDSKLVLGSTPGTEFTLHISKKFPERIAVKHGGRWVTVDKEDRVVLGAKGEDDRYPSQFVMSYPCTVCGKKGETLPQFLFFNITGSFHQHQVCGVCSGNQSKCAMCGEAVRRVGNDPTSMINFAVTSSIRCIPSKLEEKVGELDAEAAWKRISSKNTRSDQFPRYLIPLKWTCCLNRVREELREKGFRIMELALAERGTRKDCRATESVRGRYVQCVLGSPGLSQGYKLLPFVPFLDVCYVPVDRTVLSQFLEALDAEAASRGVPRLKLLVQLGNKMLLENIDSEEERATELLYVARAAGVLDTSYTRVEGAGGLGAKYLQDLLAFEDGKVDASVRAYVRAYGKCPRDTYRDGVHCRLRRFATQEGEYFRNEMASSLRGTVIDEGEEGQQQQRDADDENTKLINGSSPEQANVLFHGIKALRRVVARRMRTYLYDAFGEDDTGVLAEVTKEASKPVNDGSRFQSLWDNVKAGTAAITSSMASFFVWLMAKLARSARWLADLVGRGGGYALQALVARATRFVTSHPIVLKLILRLIGTIKTAVCKGVGDWMVDGGGLGASLDNFYNLLVYGHRGSVGVAKTRKETEEQVQKIRDGEGDSPTALGRVWGIGRSIVQQTTEVFMDTVQEPETDKNAAKAELLSAAAEAGTRGVAKAATDALGRYAGETAGKVAEAGVAGGYLGATLSYFAGPAGWMAAGGSVLASWMASLMAGMEKELLDEFVQGIWWLNDAMQAARALFDLFDPERCVAVMRPEVRVAYLPRIRYIKTRLGIPLHTEVAMLSLRADIEYIAPSLPFDVRDLVKKVDRALVDGVYDYLEKGGDPNAENALEGLRGKSEVRTLLAGFRKKGYKDLLQLLDYTRFLLFSQVRKETHASGLPPDVYSSLYDENRSRESVEKIDGLSRSLSVFLRKQQKLYAEVVEIISQKISPR